MFWRVFAFRWRHCRNVDGNHPFRRFRRTTTTRTTPTRSCRSASSTRWSRLSDDPDRLQWDRRRLKSAPIRRKWIFDVCSNMLSPDLRFETNEEKIENNNNTSEGWKRQKFLEGCVVKHALIFLKPSFLSRSYDWRGQSTKDNWQQQAVLGKGFTAPPPKKIWTLKKASKCYQFAD